MQENRPDPDKAPDESLAEQTFELTALTAEDDSLGPADLHWLPEDDQDTP